RCGQPDQRGQLSVLRQQPADSTLDRLSSVRCRPPLPVLGGLRAGPAFAGPAFLNVDVRDRLVPMTRSSIHFVAGLPRSGSTLLAAILRQNPRFRADVTSPVAALTDGLLPRMGMGTEFAPFFDEE